MPIFQVFDDFVNGVKRCVDLFRPFLFAFLDLRCIGGELINQSESAGEGRINGGFVRLKLWGGWGGDKGQDVAAG